MKLGDSLGSAIRDENKGGTKSRLFLKRLSSDVSIIGSDGKSESSSRVSALK